MNTKLLLLVIEILACGVAAILYNALSFYALSSNRLRQTELGRLYFPALQDAAARFAGRLSGLRVRSVLEGVRGFLIFVIVMMFLLMIALTVMADVLPQTGLAFLPVIHSWLMEVLTWLLIASMLGYASLKWTLDYREMAATFFAYYAVVILLIFALLVAASLYLVTTEAVAASVTELLLAAAAVTAGLCLAAVLLYVFLWAALGVPAGVGGAFILLTSKSAGLLKKHCSEDALTYVAFAALAVKWLLSYIVIPLSVAFMIFGGSPRG